MLKRRVAGWGVGLLLIAGLAALAVSRPAAAADESGWLGVYTQTLDSGLRDGMQYDGDGVLVNRVVAGSPAERAGIRRGDVIVSVNSRGVESAAELTDLIQDMRPGQNITVKVNRDRSSRTFNVTLGSRPADQGDDEGGFQWRREADDDTPAPEAPRAPRAPRAPTAPAPPAAPHGMREFHWESGPDGISGLDGLGKGMIFGGLGRGRLGVQIMDLDPDLAGYFSGTGGKGVLVTRVMDGTPAEDAGMKAGDVITRVGNDAVEDAEDLQRALRSREGKVSLTVVRRGASRTIEADLPGRDESVPRVFRMRGGPGGMPGLEKLLEPGDSDRRIVRKYTLRDDDGKGDGGDGADLRRELQDLKRELRDLRRQLDEERDRK